MDVTPEMIKMVEDHQKAERRRREKEYTDERLRLYQERLKQATDKAQAAAREIWPEMTDRQFDDLHDVFYAYRDEMDDR